MRLKKSEKLVGLLVAAIPGLAEHSIDLYPIKGFYKIRNGSWTDCYLWTGYGRIGNLGISFQSWDSMTDCVRYGIDVDREGPCSYDISAKYPVTGKKV